MLGPLFGLKALAEMRTDPRISGKRMARAGIVIGSIATAFWIGAAVWWHINVRTPILAGPIDALTAGFAGDLDGFRAGFCCEAESATDEQAIVFLAELSRRYGKYQGIRLGEMSEDAAIAQPDGAGFRKRVPYVLDFDNGAVQAVADFVVVDGNGRTIALNFSRLQIIDDNLGDMAYPRQRLLDETDGESSEVSAGDPEQPESS